jgi:hypothetical protein
MVKASNLLGDPSHQRRARSIGIILPDIARPIRDSVVHDRFLILMLISDYFISLTMCAKHHDSKKHDEGKPVPACHLCKEKYVYPEHPTPSGICHKCQTKIGVVILIIFVILGGIVFFGLI